MIRKFISILFLCICSFWLKGQHVSSVFLSKDSLSLGEETKLIYVLITTTPELLESIDFIYLDSLQSLIDKDSLVVPYYAEIDWEGSINNYADKKIINDGNLFHSTDKWYEYRDTFQATFWDIGIFAFENPIITLRDSASDLDIVETEPPILRVLPPLDIINTDTTTAILPIEDIFRESKTFEDYLKYIYTFIGIWIIALIALFIYLYKKKKAKKEKATEQIIPPKPADEIALAKLHNLAEKKLWLNEKVKEHQSQLSYIVREYLENRFDIHALESTTMQILKALKDHNLGLSSENQLSEILRMADLVKFAKMKPKVDLNKQFIHRAEDFVKDTEQHFQFILNQNTGEDE